jgi:predicted RNA-binding Zn-ribbon protein involved in translation (DUF1610 family)
MRVETRVIHIYGKKVVEVECPHCGKVQKVSVERIPLTGKEYRVKCPCGGTWAVKFEQRRHLRKAEKLVGAVTVKGIEYLVDITDLSISGCSFINKDARCKLGRGDTLHIRFRLDSDNAELVECSTIVRNTGEQTGVEFSNVPDRVKKILTFHFMA